MNAIKTIELDTIGLRLYTSLAEAREATLIAATEILSTNFVHLPDHQRTRVFYEFLNARRQREGELPLVEGDMEIIAPAALDLLQLAVNPLRSSLDEMESFAYAGTVVEGEAGSPAEWIRSDGLVGVPQPTDHWHLYIRELAFEGEEELDLFGSILLQYAESFPSESSSLLRL
jgi:hypothetical protein